MRPNRKARVAAALAVAALLASACSSPQGTEQAENSLLGKKDGGADGRGGKGRASGKGSDKTRSGAPEVAAGEAGLPSVAPGETPPLSSGAAKTETKVSSTGGTDPRGASVLVTEPDPDSEKSGLVPDYSEISSVRIEGAATQFRVTITFRADLPERMPDKKTYMIAGMGFTQGKKEEGYGFGASADVDGWTPYAGSKSEGGGEFPGTMSIDGPTIVFTIPWSALGGPRSFEWYAQASWFKSLAATTHYSLDIVPNDGPARFPAG